MENTKIILLSLIFVCLTKLDFSNQQVQCLILFSICLYLFLYLRVRVLEQFMEKVEVIEDEPKKNNTITNYFKK